MKIYDIGSAVDFQGELVNIKDGSHRVWDYFAGGDGSGKFLNFTTVRGSVSPPYSIAAMAMTDYLESLIPVLIFSGRARAVFQAAFPDELEFHPILIAMDGEEVEFHIAKTLVSCPLIDETRSTYKTRAQAKILDEDLYLPRFDTDFHVARDPRYPGIVCVSERFVTLSRANGLRIEFQELPQ